MYKITDVGMYATVKISLYPKSDDDKEYFTSWDVFEDDIVNKLDEHSFEQMPDENQVREFVKRLIDKHVEEIKNRYDVYEMNMSIEDENNKSCDDLDMDDLEWGILEDIDLTLDSYEVEQVN